VPDRPTASINNAVNRCTPDTGHVVDLDATLGEKFPQVSIGQPSSAMRDVQARALAGSHAVPYADPLTATST
jgi:hypothetical protein